MFTGNKILFNLENGKKSATIFTLHLVLQFFFTLYLEFSDSYKLVLSGVKQIIRRDHLEN